MKIGSMTLNAGDRITITCLNNDVISVTAFGIIEDEESVTIFTSDSNYVKLGIDNIAVVEARRAK
jgi:hypothetical protein